MHALAQPFRQRKTPVFSGGRRVLNEQNFTRRLYAKLRDRLRRKRASFAVATAVARKRPLYV
jgi:hypothetical protein